MSDIGVEGTVVVPMLQTQTPAMDDVFITDELYRRRPKDADYLTEKQALQELVALMAGQPDEVLPRFVELAMELTSGSSAGLSLYEPNPAPGIFRWHHLCGSLARFDGATTPRDFSPCGITLDRGGPVLTRHAERMYDWIADADIVVPEVLLVPLFVGGSEPAGTLWIVAEDEGHFNGEHARIAIDLATFVGTALRVQRTENRLRDALERQETLTNEMNHRIKNLFSLTGSMIRFGAQYARDKDDMAATLSSRLQTLATAHALILPGVGEHGGTIIARDLAEIITQIVHGHEMPEAATSRFTLSGPAVLCQPSAVSPLSLIVNELATNATKYGSLASNEGRVIIEWKVENDTLTITWRERGGAPIEGPPAHRGFGSRLLDSSIISQFKGSYDCDWRPDGVVVTISIPIGMISA